MFRWFFVVVAVKKFCYIKISDMSINIMTANHVTYIFTENKQISLKEHPNKL
jgi:hypothetical protein